MVFDGAIVADLREMLPAAEFNGLLQRAAEALPATIKELRQAWDGRDREEARRLAHKLAGLAGNFGCLALMNLARRLEKVFADQPPKRPERLLLEVDSLLPPTLEALRLQQVAATPQPTG